MAAATQRSDYGTSRPSPSPNPVRNDPLSLGGHAPHSPSPSRGAVLPRPVVEGNLSASDPFNRRESIDPSLDPLVHHHAHVQPAYFVDVSERVRKLPFKSWGETTTRLLGDPPQFADATGSVARPLEKVSSELPKQCEWLTDWEVVENENEDGDFIPLPTNGARRGSSGHARSPVSENGVAPFPSVRVKRDKDGWLYGKGWDSCINTEQKGYHCRQRTHRRVFKFLPNEDNTVEVFPALFRCLISDERFGQQGPLTFDMLRDAGNGDTMSEGGTEVGGHGRRRAGSSASSVASSGMSAVESAMLFNYLPDDQANACMDNTCKKTFNAFRRRHHCRSCGLIYCGNCAPKRSEFDNVRICNLCNNMDKQRREEVNKEVALRKEEDAARKELAGGDILAASTTGVSGVAMIRFQLQQNQNLEPVIRQRIVDEEDKALTALVVKWLGAILPRDEKEVEAELIDRWEAARRSGPRSGVASLHIKEGKGIDPSGEPTTYVTVSHNSRPREEYRTEVVKKSSNPPYNYRVSWPIYDDSKEFTFTVMAERAVGKPRPIAIGTLLQKPDTNDPKSRCVVDGSLYTENGVATVPLKAPVGTADLTGCLIVAWRVEYRDALEESDLDFCPNCGRVLPHACTCDPEVRDALLKERQAKVDEGDVTRAQVTSERYHQHFLGKEPSRQEGGCWGAEARALHGIGLREGVKRWPRRAPTTEELKEQQRQQRAAALLDQQRQSRDSLNSTKRSTGSMGDLRSLVAAAPLSGVFAGIGKKIESVAGPDKPKRDEKPADKKEKKEATTEKVEADKKSAQRFHIEEDASPVTTSEASTCTVAAPVVVPEVTVEKGLPPAAQSTRETKEAPVFNTSAPRRRSAEPIDDPSKAPRKPRRGQRKAETGCCLIM